MIKRYIKFTIAILISQKIMNGSSSSVSPSPWTADELMHGKIGEGPKSPNGSAAGTKKGGRFSMKAMRSAAKVDPLDWGMPGHLTKEEVDVFVSG